MVSALLSVVNPCLHLDIGFVANGVGSYVRQWREDHGLSQTELAELMGMQRAHLSQIESGKIALPSADIRRRLAKALPGIR